MTSAPAHTTRLQATPWTGVHGVLTDSGRHFGRHWHGTYGLGWLERGAQRSASGRGPVEAVAGELIATNPGEVHDGQPWGAATRRWRMLYLNPETVATHSDAGEEAELVRPVIRDAVLRAALQQLFARLDAWERLNDRPGTAIATLGLACDEALARVMGLLLRRHGNQPPDPLSAAADADACALRRVRECLADELAAPPSLGQLAAMVGLSRYQLLRRFERQHGLTPYAWLLWQRAERARRLIRDGQPLSQAAAASGFADQSHMTRVFGRHFGYTPGAWQRLAHPAATRFKTG